MARGNKLDVGTTRVAQNGYHYTKVADRGDGKEGWRLTHHIYAEKYLGRPLRSDERVSFVTGNKLNFDVENIVVSEKGTTSLRRRRAIIEVKIQELQVELDEINKELEKGRLVNRALSNESKT